MEFDHLFICVPNAALEAELLISAGFTEGTANRHPGQGTANRRFFFDNAFIELLFAEDTKELQSPLTKPMRLEERLVNRNPQTSPFGLCFRPVDVAPGDAGSAPFPCWQYQSEYLPAHLHVDVAKAPLTEPMWFYLSFGGRPDNAAPERQENRVHQNGVSEITSVTIRGNHQTDLSVTARTIVQHASDPAVAMLNEGADHGRSEPEHLVELNLIIISSNKLVIFGLGYHWCAAGSR